MHPIFLAHGFLGYKQFLFWRMYPGVIDALAEKGIQAYQPLVHPTASIETRARQYLARINECIGPEARFHVIAHSMGGLDMRYLISPNGLDQGHRVISLTTLSTPHQGSSLAKTPFRFLTSGVASGAAILSRLTREPDSKLFLAAIGENRWEALQQLTPDYVQNDFNPMHPNDPRVRYFSYAASRRGKRFHLSDLIRIHGYRTIYPYEGENDGMVSVASAQWGEFKGVLKSDHAEMVGLRLVPWRPNSFDHIALITKIAEELRELENEIEA